nr:hypothetical protein [uncultured Pseudogulbenkiania sp.]
MLIPSVRKIHNHNSHKVIGLSYSHKMGQQIPYESTLEVDWMLQLQHQAIVANGTANRPWYFLKCNKKYNNRGGA